MGLQVKIESRWINCQTQSKVGSKEFLVKGWIRLLIISIGTIRLVVALACARGWPLFYLDVKYAFFNGLLEEEIKGKKKMVYMLKKNLFDQKHFHWVWNKRIDLFLLQLNFSRCLVEHGIYVRFQHGRSKMLLICLYVDDLLVTSNNSKEIEELKRVMKGEFEIAYLGRMTYLFGMEFTSTSKGKVPHQRKYLSEVLKRFNMIGCNSTTTLVEIM
ncbi:hypothetical protein CR513_28132, partial [Mucuna pruriens]